MPGIGPMELGIVLLIALIFVGPKKLPGLGKSLGSGMREFKDSISGNDKPAAELAPAVATPVVPVTEQARETAAV